MWCRIIWAAKRWSGFATAAPPPPAAAAAGCRVGRRPGGDSALISAASRWPCCLLPLELQSGLENKFYVPACSLISFFLFLFVAGFFVLYKYLRLAHTVRWSHFLSSSIHLYFYFLCTHGYYMTHQWIFSNFNL